MIKSKNILNYRQEGPIKLKCTIHLDYLFSSDTDRKKFEKNWPKFIKSDPNNQKIYKKKGNKLVYYSEQLIPSKTNNKPPLLLVLGNPAGHSVTNGMFFAFEGDGREHRSWKHILSQANILNISFNEKLKPKTLNRKRREQMLTWITIHRSGLDCVCSYRCQVLLVVNGEG